MWIIVIEAMVAFFLLAFIVWWTMYSGRKPNTALPKQSEQTEAANDKGGEG